MFVWLDLETTGLDPKKGSILEIAMIATDDNFVQIGEPFVSIVKPLHMRGYEVMDDFVKQMHEKSGLLGQIYNDLYNNEWVLRDGLPRLGEVERVAIDWVRQRAIENDLGTRSLEANIEQLRGEGIDAVKLLKAVPLAGNTVHFDKRWLIEHMDDLEKLFSHRIYDVSTLTEEVKRSAPEVYKRRPGLDDAGKPIPKHRALDDIRSSIETAKFYRSCAHWNHVP